MGFCNLVVCLVTQHESLRNFNLQLIYYLLAFWTRALQRSFNLLRFEYTVTDALSWFISYNNILQTKCTPKNGHISLANAFTEFNSFWAPWYFFNRKCFKLFPLILRARKSLVRNALLCTSVARVRPLCLNMKLQDFNNLKSFVRNWEFICDENLSLCKLSLL